MIHLQILREDLKALAEAIRSEGDDCARSSQTWLESYDEVTTKSSELDAAQLRELWEKAGKIGEERITAEIGSDTLARTAAQAAAVAANNVAALTKPKVVTTVLSTLRGYALAVWAMVTFLTRPSNIGPRVVELAVAAGGVLLAAALLVPGMPPAFTLVGVLLPLAGVSTAALLTPEARGVAWRAAGCLLLVVAILGGGAYLEWRRTSSPSGSGAAEQQADGIWSLVVKVAIGFLVVFVGWWIARAEPGRRVDRRTGRKAGRSAARHTVQTEIAPVATEIVQAAREAGGKAGKNAGELAGETAGRRARGDAGASAGRTVGATAGAAAGEEAGAKAATGGTKLRRRAIPKPEREAYAKATKAGAKAGAKAGGRAGAAARRGARRGAIKADLKAVLKSASETAGQKAGEKAGKDAVRAASDAKKAWEEAGQRAGAQAGKKAGRKRGARAGRKTGPVGRRLRKIAGELRLSVLTTLQATVRRELDGRQGRADR